MRKLFMTLGLAAGVLLAQGAAAAEPVRGGTLHLVAQPEPPGINHAVTPHVATQYVSGKILQSLLNFDSELKPQPVLARQWRISDDGKTVVFDLQEGVKWHDGQPFTADDVVFTLTQFNPEIDKRLDEIAREYFESVTAVTPVQVRLQLKKPFAPLLSALGNGLRPVVPKHIYDGTDYRANPANLHPIGTGPFVFKEWKRGAYIRLARNPDYWKPGLPYLDEIIYHVIPDAASRAAAFERSDVHVLRGGDADYADVKRLAALPGVTLSERGFELYAGLAFLQINTRRPPLDNVKVRQAILHALNRSFVAEHIFFGNGKVAQGPFVSTTPYHDPGLPQYAYDPAKARQLIKESGVNVGQRPLRLINGEKGGAWERLAEYTKQALQPLGFKIEVATSDSATWYQRASNWDFDLTYNFSFQVGDPYLTTAYLYRSDYILKTSPFVNISGYDSPEADALWKRIADTPEGAQRQEGYAALERVLNRDLPLAPIFEISFPTLYHGTVRNLLQTATSLNESNESVYLDAAK